VRVSVRIRPLLTNEINEQQSEMCCVRVQDASTITMLDPRFQGEELKFSYVKMFIILTINLDLTQHLNKIRNSRRYLKRRWFHTSHHSFEVTIQRYFAME
jgi:hypothetical protein